MSLGPYIQGQQNEDSDFDILIEFSKPVGVFKFLEIEEYLTNKLGIKVDLVSKMSLKPKIGEKILKEIVQI